jgi:hypothetical protein
VKVTNHCITRFMQRRLNLSITVYQLPPEVREKVDKAIVADWQFSRMIYECGKEQIYLRGEWLYVVKKGEAIVTFLKRIPGDLDASFLADVRKDAGLDKPTCYMLPGPRDKQIEAVLQFCKQVQRWEHERQVRTKRNPVKNPLSPLEQAILSGLRACCRRRAAV